MSEIADYKVWEMDLATLSETEIGTFPVAVRGSAIAPLSAIPEPTALTLAALALFVIGCRKRR